MLSCGQACSASCANGRQSIVAVRLVVLCRMDMRPGPKRPGDAAAVLCARAGWTPGRSRMWGFAEVSGVCSRCFVSTVLFYVIQIDLAARSIATTNGA